MVVKTFQVNQTDSNGETPLIKGDFLKSKNEFLLFHNLFFLKAINGGHKHAIEMLIKNGANVNAAEKERGMTPLHYISTVSLTSHLYNGWTEDDCASNFNFICAISIFVAVKNNSIFLAIEITELLLNHGADVYAVNSDDKKPLDLASMKKGEIHEQNFK